MSKLTKDDILAMDAPYKRLIEEDILAENLVVFTEFSLRDMRSLATRIILECPYEKCSDLSHKIDVLGKKEESTHNFLFILKNALLVSNLLDILRSGSPSDFFEKPEYNPQLFMDFPSLVVARLEENERHIASRLAARSNRQQYEMIATNLLKLSSIDEKSTPFLWIYNHFYNNALLSDEAIHPLQNPAMGNQSSNEEEVNRFRFHKIPAASIQKVREGSPSYGF